MTDTKETLSGCGEQGGKGANRPRKDEKTSQNKLRRMGMMGGWMEDGTQLGIRVKLIISSPSRAY
jgi:hypothetical protein